MRNWWHMRLAILTALAFSGLGTAYAPDATDWKDVEELWYVLQIDGGKAGWMHERIESNGTQYRTTSQTHMKLSRGPMEIEIDMTSVFVELHSGKPVEISSDMKMSRNAVQTKWVFADDHVQQISKQSGREQVDKQPLPSGEWLMPMAVNRYIREQIKSGAATMKYRIIDPEAGNIKPIEVTSKRSGDEEIEHHGQKVPVTRWVTTTDKIPIESTEKYSAEGHLVLSETATGFGKVITLLSTKEQAQGDGGPAPELLFKTLIKPDRPIERPEAATRAKLRLKAKEGKLPELPSEGAQRVEAASDGRTAVLTVDIKNPQKADADDMSNAEYRDASTMVDSNDELVKKLAAKAPDGDSMAEADWLRDLVHRHISKKGMETAFARASETARTKTGDCSEHGVLLCALLRAEGIPARVASGLVYVDEFGGEDGIFGWHMWTQALIDGKWVDFDATLDQRYHAAHVLTSTSSLSQGVGGTDLATMLQLVGKIDVEVLEVQYD
ncbi:MAG: transglutaminase-like domain-containing protein [Phycisphaerales bacterium]|nr:transglutaminase-like domain-containing protein [Phycisphaerales bacterium]MCI0675206.1 transglutaminase-like domain-containing protein [Phycisphaerales bacterium]